MRVLRITIAVIEKHNETCEQCKQVKNREEVIKGKVLEYNQNKTGVMYSSGIVPELVKFITDLLKTKQFIKD